MNKINLNPVEIILSFDERDACFASLSIKGLVEHRDPYRHYDVHILYTELSKETKDSILLYQRDNIHFSFHDMKRYADLYLADFHPVNDERKSNYYFFFAGDYFLELDKALYLSWDSHVLKDVSPIHEQNLHKSMVLGTREEMADKNPSFKKYLEQGLGLKAKDFINPYLLVLNLKAMRKEKILDRFLAIKDFYSYRVWPLAEITNLVFAGKSHHLPEKFNSEAIYRDEENIHKDYVVTYGLVKKPWDDPERISSFDFWYFAKVNPEFALNRQARFDAEKYGEFLPTYEDEVIKESEKECLREDNYRKRYNALRRVKDGDLLADLFFVKEA